MKEIIRVTISEASELSGLSSDEIFRFIEEEWIIPVQKDEFDDEDICRIKLIKQLMDDLGANEESIPIILHLIDQIHQLRAQIQGYNESLN